MHPYLPQIDPTRRRAGQPLLPDQDWDRSPGSLIRIEPPADEGDPELRMQLYRDDLERMTERLLQVGEFYRTAGESDYLPSTPGLREDPPAYRLARLFAQTDRPPPAQGDFAILDEFQARLNAQRREVGLEPVDWRHAAAAVGSEPSARMATPSGRTPQELSDGSTRIVVDEHLRRVGARLGVMLANGTADGAILRFMRDNGVDPDQTNIRQGLAYRRTPAYRAWARQNPRRPYPIGDRFYSTEVRQGLVRRMVSGAANSPGGAYTVAAADAVTLGTLDNLSPDPEQARANMAALEHEYPTSSAAGNFAGTAIGTLGFELAAARAGLHGFRAMRAADFGYGAGYGAGSADDGSRLFGAAREGTLGLLGGMAGRALLRRGGRLLTGPGHAVTLSLPDDHPLGAGPMAGRTGPIEWASAPLEPVRDRLPLVGGAIRDRIGQAYRAFNRQSFDDALAPVGANTGGAIGEEGLRSAHAAVAAAYRDALDGLRLEADDIFVDEVARALESGHRIPGQGGDYFRYIVGQRVAPQLNGGVLTGEGYQAMRLGLRQDRHAMRGRPLGAEFEGAVRSLEGAMERLVRRQAPDIVPGLDRADRAFALTRTVEEAVRRAGRSDGLFTPADLRGAVADRPPRFTGLRTDEHESLLELPGSASRVLPPPSGTGFRYDPGRTGAILPPDAERLLISRPSRMRRAGEALIRRQRLGGMFGAWALPYFAHHGGE